jgi:hypothetical protein
MTDPFVSPTFFRLFESFAATTRGKAPRSPWRSRASVESGIKVLFVTHLYEFAGALYERRLPDDR